MPRGAARETEAVDPPVNVNTDIPTQPGLEFPRFFSDEGTDPFDERDNEWCAKPSNGGCCVVM